MILLDEVIEVFGLSQFSVQAGVVTDAIDGCGVGAALVDGDLLWLVVQVYGALKKAPGRRTVKAFSLARHFDVCLVHLPA